jgi:hypothetical protein
MAREQRKDVDYFPHECIHGRKMNIIESKYGNDGYATWFKLLEQLGKANNHYIDISDEMNLMFLTSTFRIDEEKTLQILNDLARLEAIDRFLYENHKIIWSEKFCNSIEDAYRKRKSVIFKYSDILNEISKKNGQSTGSLTSKHTNLPEVIPKEEKSKEEKSKEEKSKEEFADESAGNVSDEIQQPNSSEKKRKKVAPKKETETMHWKALVDTWFKFYQSKFNIDPTFNAAQGKLLKSIIQQFEKLTEAKDKSESLEFDWNEDRAIRVFVKFLENAWSDKWLQEHFLLKNLLSNFDTIISKKVIENGNQQQQSSGTKKQFRFSTPQAIKAITGSDT